MPAQPDERPLEPVFGKRRLTDDQDAEDLRYWLSRPVEERIAAAEELRRQCYGQDYAIQYRLPRPSDRIERRRR
ncbi:MAG: hypothetical protein KF858_11660 [Candidatus Sumerlaeia bacterium]|nr:hypothetical protein [Candidatus Sumerlaeia bacterium]